MFEIYWCKSPKNSGSPNVKQSGTNIIHFLCGILDNDLIWFFLFVIGFFRQWIWY